MGTFKSFIENAAKQKSIAAVDSVIEEIEDEVDKSMTQYYGEYDPKLYIRTGLMSDSVLTIPASNSGLGAEGKVYVLDAKYAQPWFVSDSIEAADRHTHGGYHVGAGTSVWKEPLERIKKDEEAVWRKALVDAGFDIT